MRFGVSVWAPFSVNFDELSATAHRGDQSAIERQNRRTLHQFGPCAPTYGTGRVLFYLRLVVVTDGSGAGSEQFMANFSWLDSRYSTSVSQLQTRTVHGTQIPASSPAPKAIPCLKRLRGLTLTRAPLAYGGV